MKKKVLRSFALACIMLMAGTTPSWAIDQDANGNYLIHNGQDLVDFAEMVNNMPTEGEFRATSGISAVITADIDMKGLLFPGIGNDSHEHRRFHGTLDGQGHTISNLVMDGDCVGLVRVASDNCVIKNLVLDGSCEFKGTGRNAAFVSCCNWPEWGTNVLRIENCGNEANVTGTGANCAAFLGCNYNGNLRIEIENCYNLGHIKGSHESAVFSGWFGNGSSSVKNSWSIAEVEGLDGDNYFGRGIGGGNYVNTYKVTSIAGYESAWLSNGHLCAMLNGNNPEGPWRQTIGTDAHPTTLSTSLPVYANGAFYCDGTSKGEVVYANANQSVTDAHQWGENDLCGVCKKHGKEAAQQDGIYQIANIGNLVWFANYVNAGHTDARCTLTADIDQADADYQPIGNTGNIYKGEIDGQGHSVTLHIDRPDADYQGLCGVVTDGVYVHDIIIKGSVKGRNSVGAIAGGSNGGSNNALWTLLERCGNEADITATGNNAGGMIGVNMGGGASFIFNDCYNAGKVKGGESGAFSGWSGGGWSVFNNCLNMGIAGEGGDDFTRNNGTQLKNCYYLTGCNNNNGGNLGELSAAQLTNGEAVALLNGEEGKAWMQGESYPLPFAKEAPYVFEPSFAYNVEDGQEIDVTETLSIHLDVLAEGMTDEDLYIEGKIYGKNYESPVIAYTDFEEGMDIDLSRLEDGIYTIEITKVACGDIVGMQEDGWTPIYQYELTAEDGQALSTLNFTLSVPQAEPTEVDYSVNPKSGATLESLQQITLQFTEDTAIGNGMITVKKDGQEIAKIDAEAIFPDDWFAPVTDFNLNINATEPGKYTIEIPEGYFQQGMGNVDVAAITLSYTVEEPAEMAVVPSLFSGVVGSIDTALNGHSAVGVEVAEGLRVEIANCPEAIGVSFMLNEMKMGEDAEGTFWSVGKELAVGEIEMTRDSYAAFEAPIYFYGGTKYQLTLTIYAEVNGEPAEIATYTYEFNGTAAPANGAVADGINSLKQTTANGKYMKDGKVVIVKNGKTYNTAGQQVK